MEPYCSDAFAQSIFPGARRVEASRGESRPGESKRAKGESAWAGCLQ